ncbi:hypothetical protein, partial [Shewanella algae]|uniref:hypothetical protein n=1 Tax=Shewanella algae TaxID=38313 RepID=UPI00313DB953
PQPPWANHRPADLPNVQANSARYVSRPGHRLYPFGCALQEMEILCYAIRRKPKARLRFVYHLRLEIDQIPANRTVRSIKGDATI